METVEYSIHLHASIDKVWEKLWNKKCNAEWTQFFEPQFYIKSDWKVNGKTYFLKDEKNGMVSTISSLDQPNEIVFQHLGLLVDGVEDLYGKNVAQWSGVEEKYFLRSLEVDHTELFVIVHIYNSQRAEFDEGFRKGFEILKEFCEQ